ncbi:beta transducin-like protein het-e4s [Lasallia pustulata]|uniref:Beta transducin-like protein het-e4s n=1 Tax=Lasallia pustulata TaxID=136370 RepID=A0A1W5DCU4_9LECA|nr:beta transducin-like protein het-e4s [Lasallia pustulata]
MAEAEAMYRRALEGKEKAWGPEHTSTLDTVNNLGILYADQGKMAEAEVMYRRALEGYEKAWGPEHTSTLDTVNNLGILYADQGKMAEAEAMYRRALEGKEKAWGPEHTSTLDTVNNLGKLYADQGKMAESSTCQLGQTEIDLAMNESSAATLGPNLATETRLSDDRHDYEDILNPERYLYELEHLEGRVVRNSSLKNFEKGLYVIEKSRHNLDSLSSDDDLSAVKGALQEAIDQGSSAVKARHIRSLCESYSIVSQVLNNLDFLEESRFCGSFFTILVATRSRPEVAQVLRIKRSTVNMIAGSIRASVLALAALFSTQNHSQLLQGLSSILEVPKRHCIEFLDDLDILTVFDEQSSLNMVPELTAIRLATLIIDLGLVMYSGSHGSNIGECLRTSVPTGNLSSTPPPREPLDESDPFRLQVLNEAATYGFQCSMTRLACLEDFIGGPVWVFKHLQSEPTIAVPDRRLFLSTSIEDFSDMWGPVWAVPSKERNLIKYYNVSKGMIRKVPLDTFSVANVDDHEDEVACHWYSWAELSNGEDLASCFDDLPIKASDKLLIGLPFRDNLSCQSKLKEIERVRAVRMVPAGTFSEAWFTDAYSIGANASFHGVGLSTQRTRKKRPRRTHKEAIWDKIRNAPQSFHPGIFNLWLGLELSHCTGNARRIKMKDLFCLDPIKSYLKEVSPEWYRSELGGQFLEATSDSDTDKLHHFWDGLTAEKKLEVVGIVQMVLDPLQFTGVREDGDFGVGFLRSREDAQIILLKQHLNNWTGFVKDSETVTTYAILNEICLECALRDYETNLCRSKGCKPGFTVLETRITVPHGISNHEQLRFFRLGEQGRLAIISKKDDHVIVAEWQQAEIREKMNRFRMLLQPQREILHDREVVKDAEMGDQIFQVYIRSQQRSNSGWGEASYGF